jgi:hypothetical protein
LAVLLLSLESNVYISIAKITHHAVLESVLMDIAIHAKIMWQGSIVITKAAHRTMTVHQGYALMAYAYLVYL